jgi:conjugative transfer region protein (TIGR03748 family)
MVQTVGQALDYTLMRTGYRLVDPSALEPQAARLLDMPLPESQRVVGPYRVRTVLEVLTGQNWRWNEDPLQRQVWFTVQNAQVTQVTRAVQTASISKAATTYQQGTRLPAPIPRSMKPTQANTVPATRRDIQAARSY